MYLYVCIVIILLSYFISRKDPKYRGLLIGVNFVVSVIYILWRFTTIPIHSGLFSFILGTCLYIAELLGLISLFNFKYLFTREYRIEKKTIRNFENNQIPNVDVLICTYNEPLDLLEKTIFNFKYLFTREYRIEKKTIRNFENNQIPNVDVLICTYNEPLDLLEKTIVASIGMDYIKNKFEVYVCDDGRRNSLRKLCKKYNVKYITREDNEGAKAGNINNALKYIKGDLFAVLDADMIPQKDFLSKTVGYFVDENLAFVQTPQVYYNQDMYQYNLNKSIPNEQDFFKKDFLSKTVGYFVDENLAFVQTPQVYYNQDMYQYNLNKSIPNEQDFFMREIEEARASINAVLHVGTNAVFRKSAVEEIGGYPTCSITEDMAVGMLLQSKGYITKFINEVLVLGLSATTFTELVKQRDRWCRGNLQVLKKYNPLFTKGLTLSQKIAYFDGGVYWFSSLQKIIYIICPLVYLITQKLIIDTDVNSLMKMFIPYLIGQILIFNTLSPKTRSLKWAHYYEVAMAPHISLSILKELLFFKVNFNVTSKNITNDRGKFQFRIAMPHIIIMIATIIGWYISGKLILDGSIHIGAYLINMAWSIFNFVGSIICIKVAYQKPIFRNTERVKVEGNIRVNLEDGLNYLEGKIVDISEKGIGIELNEYAELELDKELALIIKNVNFRSKVVRQREMLVGLTYDNLNAEQMKIVMDIYVDNMAPYYNPNRTQRYIENKKLEKSSVA